MTTKSSTYQDIDDILILGLLALKEDSSAVFWNKQTKNLFFCKLESNNQLDLTSSKAIEILQKGQKVDLIPIEASLSIYDINDRIYIWFKSLSNGSTFRFLILVSDDFTRWEIVEQSQVQDDFETNPVYDPQRQILISYTGKDKIYYQEFSDLNRVRKSSHPILELRESFYDCQAILPKICIWTNDGILVIYQSNLTGKHLNRIQFSRAILAKNKPEFVVHRDQTPIWEHDQKDDSIYSYLGFVEKQGKISIYLKDEKQQLFVFEIAIPYSKIIHRKLSAPIKKINLKREDQNPVVTPLPNDWESMAVFNPAAIEIDGRVHLFYRAQGFDSLSAIGYASSGDGVNFDERLDKPIYTIQLDQNVTEPSPYMSGGGMGGVEDPRVTFIDDKLYMLYALYNGYEQARLAMTTLDLADFRARKWNWTPYQYLSPKPTVWGTGNKSGAVFPEKINGKYVVLHRIWPNISIDYLDDLDFDSENKWLEAKDIIPPRQGMWDSAKLGAGAPPIKTKDGWLLIYQAVGKYDGKYKIGAMLLDLENPAKVLYRSNNPILEPEDWYETTGLKPGVAYPCGAVIKDNKLLVYYGAADNVVCVASADIEPFMYDLMHQHESHPMHKVELFYGI